jgi:hypothetical protein
VTRREEATFRFYTRETKFPLRRMKAKQSRRLLFALTSNPVFPPSCRIAAGATSETDSMKTLQRLILGAIALGLAATLSAQPPAGGPPHRGPGGPGGRRGNPIVRVLDADKDGVISAAELASAPAALRTLDVNGDGIVSQDELHPGRPANAPTPPADAPPPPAGAADHPRPVDPIMLALDANGDGSLSAAEIANATTSLSALDLNKDGKLTPDEYRPLPPDGMPPSRR